MFQVFFYVTTKTLEYQVLFQYTVPRIISEYLYYIFWEILLTYNCVSLACIFVASNFLVFRIIINQMCDGNIRSFGFFFGLSNWGWRFFKPSPPLNPLLSSELLAEFVLEKSNELSLDRPPGAVVITLPSTGSKSSFKVPPIMAGCLESCSVDVSILDKPKQHAGMVSINVGLLWVKRGFINRLSSPDQSFANQDFPGVAPCWICN